MFAKEINKTNIIYSFIFGSLIGGSMLVLSPLKGMVIAIALPLVIFSFIRPDISLLLMIAGIPWETLGRLSSGKSMIPISIAKLFGFIALAGWLASVLYYKRKVVFSKRYILPILFVLICFLSLSAAVNQKDGIKEIIRILSIYAMSFLVINLVSDMDMIKKIGKVSVFSGVILSIYSIYQRFVSTHYFSEATAGKSIAIIDTTELATLGEVVRSSGGTTHPDWLAFYLLFVIGMNLILLLTLKSTLGKGIYIGTLAIIIAGLISSFSRTGGIGVLIMLLFFFIFKIIRLTPKIISFLIIGVLLTGFLMPSKYRERVFTLVHLKKSHNVTWRLKLFKSGYDMFKDHPLLGVGIGNYEANIGEYAPYGWMGGVESHNLYVDILSETGAVGTIIFLAILIIIWMDFERAKKISKLNNREDFIFIAGLESIFITFCACGMVLHIMERKEFWLIIALSVVVCRIVKEKYSVQPDL